LAHASKNYAKYKENFLENYAAERNLFFSELRAFANRVCGKTDFVSGSARAKKLSPERDFRGLRGEAALAGRGL
jgi:hypothetical protein